MPGQGACGSVRNPSPLFVPCSSENEEETSPVLDGDRYIERATCKWGAGPLCSCESLPLTSPSSDSAPLSCLLEPTWLFSLPGDARGRSCLEPDLGVGSSSPPPAFTPGSASCYGNTCHFSIPCPVLGDRSCSIAPAAIEDCVRAIS